MKVLAQAQFYHNELECMCRRIGLDAAMKSVSQIQRSCTSDAKPQTLTCFLILDTRIWRPEKDEIQSPITGRLSAMPRTEP